MPIRPVTRSASSADQAGHRPSLSTPSPSDRRRLLVGAAAFGAASLLAAWSTSAAMLNVARALLGVAGATVAPSTLSLIRSMFADSQQRTVAVSVWITSFSVGGAIGPLPGGVLLEWFWWGSVFLLADPLLDLRLFRSAAFTAALTTNMVSFFVGFGTLLFITQYLQLVLGL